MRTLGRLLLIVVVLGAVVAGVFYTRPLWVLQQQTRFGLFLSRVQSNYVLTPAGRVHYYEAEPRIPGGGIPLVLVHGLADRDESWAPMLKRLKRAGFHVYAPDLLGCGRSPRPQDGDYSVAGEEKFVYDFIQSIGLQKTDLGGWSMGGWISLRLALDHPELIDRVVVYDSAGLRFDAGQPETLFHPKSPEDVQRLFDQMEPGAAPFPPYVARDLLKAMAEKQWVTDRTVQSMLTGRDLVDDKLPSLRQPLLIVWGANDRLTPLAVGQQMHQLAPKSELDILEGCGHLAPLHCSDRAAPATADFLKAEPPPEGAVRTLRHMH
ncbi:MAG TPA: alpha/beta hydrolase [Acidobacteriaceae bacterium]|jgi:pimeloyl-ACP methyl ester carboxylesterase|nr:alpha/beta hydrolase [Acidobacteriaceae bacterium]